ncbi:MAG: hypothetical protein FWD53_09230 [Phycisphaerales bacterium]|nr:hypothetical protein [Phycisphaerales bacterium]
MKLSFLKSRAIRAAIMCNIIAAMWPLDFLLYKHGQGFTQPYSLIFVLLYAPAVFLCIFVLSIYECIYYKRYWQSTIAIGLSVTPLFVYLTVFNIIFWIKGFRITLM